MKSEWQKMISGELYNARDPKLSQLRRKARQLTKQLNDSHDHEEELRKNILNELLGAPGENPWIEPPFYCDYGCNILLEGQVFFNFNCVVLDVCTVQIGGGTLIGPAVQIYTATHPVEWKKRAEGLESGKEVTIGRHCWIGGGAIINPGVTIGDRTVIGAGSIVTRDIPSDVFAAGNPCRVIRKLKEG